MAGSPLEIASSWGLRSGHELDADPEGQAAVHCPPPPGAVLSGRGSRGGGGPVAARPPEPGRGLVRVTPGTFSLSAPGAGLPSQAVCLQAWSWGAERWG